MWTSRKEWRNEPCRFCPVKRCWRPPAANTLIIHNEDTPGCIAEVTMSLALRRINIASMQVFRAAVGRYAVMVLECDSHIPHTLEQQLAVMPGLLKVTCLNVDEPEGMEE